MAWLVGFGLTAGLVAVSSRRVEFREAVPTIVVLGLALSALGAEIAALARSDVRGESPITAPLADGVVERIPIRGVEARPNRACGRFQEFLRMGSDAPGTTRVNRLRRDQPRLLGRVALISVYVGRDGVAWDDEEIARGQAAVERASLWLETQAIRHSARANFSLVETYFRVQNHEADEVEVAFAPEGDDVGPMEAQATTKAVVMASRAAASLGFSDVVDLFGQINLRVDADAVAWLFLVRRAGRSLAIPSGEAEIDGVSLVVCYSRESSFPEPTEGPGRVDPTTVAHELLHLFGATDKYGVSLGTFPRGTVGSRDIMRLDQDRLARLTIGELTAREIGWKTEKRSQLAK